MSRSTIFVNFLAIKIFSEESRYDQDKVLIVVEIVLIWEEKSEFQQQIFSRNCWDNEIVLKIYLWQFVNKSLRGSFVDPLSYRYDKIHNNSGVSGPQKWKKFSPETRKFQQSLYFLQSVSYAEQFLNKSYRSRDNTFFAHL